MSDQSEASVTPHRGVTYAVPPAEAEKYWPWVEEKLQAMEDWSQCISAADVRQNIANGCIRLWTSLEQTGRNLLAISAMQQSARGQICMLWLIASHFSDDASISAMVDECEVFARAEGCVVLAINAYPALAEKITGKFTSVILERDLRASRKLN
jgi:hypothetical protein